MSIQLLMGNEAFAHAALEAGCGFFAGYPGTPSSELIETVAKIHAEGRAEGIHVEWSTNEKAALELAAAASLSGVRSMMTCKQVGLNVASDALMSLNYLGVRGGLVLFVADDPGPISSQTEQDTRRFAEFAKVPVFDPATPEQGFAMIKQAFELSESFGCPVIVRPTTRIDHASTFFDIEDYTSALPSITGGFKRNPEEFVIFPPRAYEAHGQINERLASLAHDFSFDDTYARFNPIYENGQALSAPLEVTSSSNYSGSSSAILGIVAGGVSTQYALEAIDIIAHEAARVKKPLPNFRFMQIGTPYPFPKRAVGRFIKNLTDVLVLEELDSFLEEELLKFAATSFLPPRIHGKLTDEAQARGENTTEDAVMRIAAFFDAYRRKTPAETALENTDEKSRSRDGAQQTFTELVRRVVDPAAWLRYEKTLPSRPANLCAGCPHRGSFYAMKNALAKLKIKREDAVFCGDIGCYTLGNAAPLDAVDSCLCMGGGITMAQGFSVADPSKKCIGFIGDSTFFASGMTGVANALYNDHDITICILDNATTAMTGSQPHPGTGVTLMGDKHDPIDTAKVLEAMGVKTIVMADPLDREQAEEACMQALEVEGPSAVIFESPCIWLKPFDTPAMVNVDVCTGCKKCITEIGCPAIGFDPDAKGARSARRGMAVIDRTQCNGCRLCLQVCPFHAIDIVEHEPIPPEKPVRQSRLNRGGAVIGGERAWADSKEQLENWERGAGAEREGADERADYLHDDIGDTLPEYEDVAEPLEERRGRSASEPFMQASDELRARMEQEGLLSSDSKMPIMPMIVYEETEDFSQDELYDDMSGGKPAIATGRVSDALAHTEFGEELKEGYRRYSMKTPVAPADRVFARPAGSADGAEDAGGAGSAYFATDGADASVTFAEFDADGALFASDATDGSTRADDAFDDGFDEDLLAALDSSVYLEISDEEEERPSRALRKRNRGQA